MEETLDFNNILGAAEIDNLFLNNDEIEDTPDNENSSENDKTNETTEVVDVDTMFTEEPESVGSEENNDNKEQEDTDSDKKGSSPNNFYSSIAQALKDAGIFPDLDDSSVADIQNPEDFRDLVERQIQAGLDERQKRIDEALNLGIEPSEINKYENAINFLKSIKEDAISNEDDNSENLRKNLIYQDFINRGYSKERAEREVKKSLDSGTDIEDAKEALQSNLEFFNNKYDFLIKESKNKIEEENKKKAEQAEKLKSSILNDKDVFGDLSVDKSTRQKVFDNISKPIYKNPETGEYYTAIQKYEMENKTEFLKNIGLLFTLTDGFKNMDNLIKGKVRKEVKKSLRELENTLNNTVRTSDGNLKFVNSGNDDPESFIGKNWKLDI